MVSLVVFSNVGIEPLDNTSNNRRHHRTPKLPNSIRMPSDKKLRVGIVGAGEVAQVIHLPTLALLNHL